MSSSDNRAPPLIAVTAIFISISAISAGLRLFTRLRLLRWIGIDDILIFCATFAAIVQGAGIFIATNYGLARHIADQPPEWRRPFAIADLTASLAYSTAAMFVKLSLLSFYLRLSRERIFTVLTYVLIFISAGFGVASILSAALQCIPVSMLWDASQPGHCIDVNSFYFANAGIHILTEILIYLLPIRTLWNLHLPARQKLGLCGLLSVGAMLIIISCYRIVTLRDLLGSDDFPWAVTTPLMWYTIEINLAIFIACGPAFLAFFRHYLPVVFGGSSDHSRFKSRHHRHSYPLGSVHRSTPAGNRAGNNTLITTNTISPYLENGSEEMIMSNSGIQKKVDVWVENELVKTGKSDSRSNVSTVEGNNDLKF